MYVHTEKRPCEGTVRRRLLQIKEACWHLVLEPLDSKAVRKLFCFGHLVCVILLWQDRQE